MKPTRDSYPDYYENYIPLVEEDNLLLAFRNNRTEILAVITSIPAEKGQYAYAEKKWTIKQLIGHMIDTERIFAYRALRFARKDPQQPLPFEENDYAANMELEHRSLKDLIYEFETVRAATISLFESFTAQTLELKGKTAAGETSVLALGYVICGHAKHHLNILKERYLKN
jgi:hypothetical protein